MSIIYVLIPLAILIVALAVVIFFWAVKNNQFDDLERQGHSILFDDDIAPQTKPTDKSKNTGLSAANSITTPESKSD